MLIHMAQCIAAGASTILGARIVKDELVKPSVVRDYKRVAVGASLTAISVVAVASSFYSRYQELVKN